MTDRLFLTMKNVKTGIGVVVAKNPNLALKAII